jgi:hypothetical protein
MTKLFKKALIDDGASRSILCTTSTCVLNDNPFGNCQIYSVSYMSSLLSDNLCDSDTIKILKQIDKKSGKTQLICDIYRTYESKLEKLFPQEDIMFKSQYRNSTGNLMTIYMIHTKTLKS